MLLNSIRPLRYFAQALSVESSPRQLALGMAFGVAIGLVPKGNLVAVVLTTLMFATRVNLGMGMATALIVSLISPYLDSVTHGIGLRVLSIESVQSQLAQWYEKPLVPWTSLNNTVVMGSFLLGIALFYPVYHVSESMFVWLQPKVQEKLKRYRLYQLLFGTDLATRWRIG